MARKKSQKEKLLDLLLDSSTGVTSRRAERRGIRRVPARIYDLRREGYDIYTDFNYSRKTGRREYYWAVNSGAFSL